MKTKTLAIGVMLCVALSSCKKEQSVQPQNVQEQTNATFSQPGNNYGISVADNRLKFETIAQFDVASKTVGAEFDKFMAYVGSIDPFISKKEQRAGTDALTKSTEECNSPLNDDYAESLVDGYYMMDVGNWTVKLNGEDQKYYAFYRVGLLEAEIDNKIEEMRTCRFVGDDEIISFGIDKDLVEWLTAYELFWGGDTHAFERTCKDVVADDRTDTEWAYEYEFGGLTTGKIPECRLHYHRGWLNHGHIAMYAERNIGDMSDTDFMNNFTVERFESTFYEKCGPTHNIADNANIHFTTHGQYESSGDWWTHVIYSGTRLKAGDGSMKARLTFKKTDKFAVGNYSTRDLEIVF